MTLNNASSRPLYLQLQDFLLDEMESYVPEQKLPSERDLAERHGVSRMTARQALQSLQQRGLTYTQVGKGTYLKRLPVSRPLDKLSSFTDDMQEMSIRPHSQVLAAELIDASDQVAGQLKVATDSRVVLLKRLRLANQQPIAIETAYLAHSRCPGLLSGHDFSTHSLYAVLQERYGLNLAYAEQTIRADNANPNEQQLLSMADPTQVSVLRMDRVTFDSNEVPVEYVSSVYHGAYYEFRVSLRAAHAQLVMPMSVSTSSDDFSSDALRRH